MILQVGSFNNPPTTADITGVSGFLIGANGNAKSITKNAVISGFMPAYMIVSSAVSSSPKVGDNGQTLTISFTTVNSFLKTYYISM